MRPEEEKTIEIVSMKDLGMDKEAGVYRTLFILNGNREMAIATSIGMLLASNFNETFRIVNERTHLKKAGISRESLDKFLPLPMFRLGGDDHD